jgi:hypothetical protein
MKLGLLRFLKYSFGSVLVVAGVIGGLGGLNLYTYHRFTQETRVASLAFEQTGDQAYSVTLTPAGQAARRFILTGDEWQLDARMIKWTDWLTFLGESPLYRLDRISGRYVAIDDARKNGQLMHDLSEPVGLDVWAFARKAGEWLPGIDAAYGSSVFLPMADGAAYEVTMSHTGLLARRRSDEGRR